MTAVDNLQETLDQNLMDEYNIIPNADGLPEEGEDDRPGFHITDDRLADWAVRKVVDAQRRIAERKTFADTEVDRIRTAQEIADTRDQRTIDFFTGHLARYFEHLTNSGALGRRKSHRLPNGILQARKKRPKWRRQDETALLKWAKAQGLIRETAAWADISRRLQPASNAVGAAAIDTTTGEVVPGLLVEEPSHDEFSVKGVDL